MMYRTIYIPESEYEQLEALAHDSNQKDVRGVLNSACTLYRWAVQERKAGKLIASGDKETRIFTPVHLASLDSIGK